MGFVSSIGIINKHFFIVNEKFYKLKVKYETLQKKKNYKGETPFHEAAKEGDISKCKLIITHIEDKNPLNFNGKTPLQMAVKSNHSLVVNVLTHH